MVIVSCIVNVLPSISPMSGGGRLAAGGSVMVAVDVVLVDVVVIDVEVVEVVVV